MSSAILRPGMKEPPFVVPYCARCDQPVERYTFMPVTSPYFLEIEALCCGSTQGAHVSTDEIMRVKAKGEKLYLISKSGKSYHHTNDLRRAF